MNQSKKIVLVASLAAFVVAVAWFLLLYQPQSNKLSDLNDDIESAKSEEVGLKAELSALEALKEQEPQIDAAVARADGLVPASPSLAAFMGEANAVATEAGLNWVTITPSEPEDTGVVGQVSLVVDLEGGFFETVNYLERMESMPRLVTWDSMQVSRGSEGGLLTTQLTGRMFNFNGAAPAATTAEAPTTPSA